MNIYTPTIVVSNALQGPYTKRFIERMEETMYEKEEYKTCEKCGHTPYPTPYVGGPPARLNKLEFIFRVDGNDLMQFTCPRCRYEWFVEIEE